MSIVYQISLAFAKLLNQGLAPNSVHLEDPQQFLDGGIKGIWLWLYQVLPDEFSRNAQSPVVQEATSAAARRRSAVPPLGINLHYLVTPMIGDVQSNHDALEQMLLTIHEAPILTVRNYSLGLNEQVRISVLSDTLEDRVRLWESLDNKYYRLSFSCLLRTARLVSPTLVDEAALVSVSAGGSLEIEKN